MGADALENLARIGQLKKEAFNPHEFERLLNLAEYEGYIDVSEGTIEELCELIPVLLTATRHLCSTK